MRRACASHARRRLTARGRRATASAQPAIRLLRQRRHTWSTQCVMCADEGRPHGRPSSSPIRAPARRVGKVVVTSSADTLPPRENPSRDAPRTTLAAPLAGISIVCENRAQLDSRMLLAARRDGASRTSPATSRVVPDHSAARVRHQCTALLRGSASIMAHAQKRWRAKTLVPQGFQHTVRHTLLSCFVHDSRLDPIAVIGVSLATKAVG